MYLLQWVYLLTVIYATRYRALLFVPIDHSFNCLPLQAVHDLDACTFRRQEIMPTLGNFNGQHGRLILHPHTENSNTKNFRSRSPISFVDLPGEIKNLIYPQVLVDPRSHLQRMQVEKDRSKPRPKILYPAILRTCRKTYDEGLAYLYADNEFLVNIWPDLAWYPNSQPAIYHRSFNLTKNLRIRICHCPDELLTESDMTQIQSHVRKLCMTLQASKVVLENMRITMQCEGLHLSHNEEFHRDIFRPLKELRVSGTFKIHGSSHATTEESTLQYLADIESIVRGQGLPKEGIPAETSTTREMYQDLMDTVTGFRRALAQIPNATPSIDDFISRHDFNQRLEHISTLLELHHAPKLRDDPERLAQIDMKEVLFKLEELYHSCVPNDMQWGSTDVSHFSEVVTPSVRSLLRGKLTALRDWLYMRHEFQDMGPEGAPCGSKWENAIVEDEGPLAVGEWGSC